MSVRIWNSTLCSELLKTGTSVHICCCSEFLTSKFNICCVSFLHLTRLFPLKAKELQTLHNLRKLFVQDLATRVKKVNCL